MKGCFHFLASWTWRKCWIGEIFQCRITIRDDNMWDLSDLFLAFLVFSYLCVRLQLYLLASSSWQCIAYSRTGLRLLSYVDTKYFHSQKHVLPYQLIWISIEKNISSAQGNFVLISLPILLSTSHLSAEFLFSFSVIFMVFQLRLQWKKHTSRNQFPSSFCLALLFIYLLYTSIFRNHLDNC